jgi:hypothetical protein
MGVVARLSISNASALQQLTALTAAAARRGLIRD